MKATPHTGRGWAYAGAVLGGAVSTAANIAHSYVPPPNAGQQWHPPLGAVIGAVFWPLALFIAAEILARIQWPAGASWLVLRFLGLLPVALVAAVVSYRHMSGLLHFYHEDSLTQRLGPLAVDGLMTMATAALMASNRHRTAARPAVASAPPDAPLAEPSPAAQVVSATRLRLPASCEPR